MRKIFEYISKRRIIVVILLIAFGGILGLAAVAMDKNSQRQEDLSKKVIAKWDELEPGKSTNSEVENKLGKTINNSADRPVKEYASTSPTAPHKAIYEDEKVMFLKETVTLSDNKSIADLITLYGQAPYILYGDLAINGYYLFVYSDIGVAYVGNSVADVLWEVWYFEPVNSIDEFIAKWATNYSKILPPEHVE